MNNKVSDDDNKQDSSVQEESKTDTGSSPLAQIVNPKNLALLKQGDRFVIMGAGLIVVAALGAIATIDSSPEMQTSLALISIIIVAGLVILVQWRSISMKGAEADLHAQAFAAESINGNWWQLVYSEDHPGLSYVGIAMSEVAERHAMQGISFNSEGKRRARWSSDAIAIKTTSPVEIYYVWRGMILDYKVSNIISGFGRFRFDSVGRELKPMEAEGAFTHGSTSLLDFEEPCSVELIRFTETESAAFAKDSTSISDLAKKAFDRFNLDKNRSFSGRPSA
jgi:hypothetical protein